jgi:CheY-like chemotaxis protein
MDWKILIADDDVDIRMLLKVMLIKKYGCEVIESSDGFEALELINARKLDLAILDIMMPKMNGDKVFIEIRKNSIYKDLPILFCSALNNKDYLRLLFSMINDNVTDFIMKPIQFPILYNKIESLIEKSDLFSEHFLVDESGTGRCVFPEIGVEYSLQVMRIEGLVEDDQYSIIIGDSVQKTRCSEDSKPIILVPCNEEGNASQVVFKFFSTKKKLLKIFYRIL